VVSQPLRWFDDETDQPPFLKALEQVRRQATREGWCYHHVQAIMVAIDQYAEAATGNREYFLNKPHSIGGPESPGTLLSMLVEHEDRGRTVRSFSPSRRFRSP
jgi:hypothetical protein